jgi:hypothetical protein
LGGQLLWPGCVRRELPVRPSLGGWGDARFKVEIPERANYAVYARWPKVKGLNDSVPVGVETASGTKWTKVNQQ